RLLICLHIPPATSVIYTLSLHDALPIYEPDSGFDDEDNSADGSRRTVNRRNGLMLTPLLQAPGVARRARMVNVAVQTSPTNNAADRKSTRLNSSHVSISYAVFCLKKKTK